MERTVASILLTLLISITCFADIPRPDKPKNVPAKSASVDTHLSIELDRDAKEAKLIIPRSQLKQLRAELEALDSGSDDTAFAAGVTRIQTIVGGMFLSLAFVFAGFVFVRSGRLSANGTKVAAASAIVFAGGAFATIAFGNAGPPAEARSITGKMFTRALHIYGFGGGKIKLEVSDDVKTPKLIVPNPADETRQADE
jgi:hypothetical protein